MGRVCGLTFEVIIEESNRDHNYIWSSVQCGNYIYIDTCKNPISGIYKKIIDRFY